MSSSWSSSILHLSLVGLARSLDFVVEIYDVSREVLVQFLFPENFNPILADCSPAPIIRKWPLLRE